MREVATHVTLLVILWVLAWGGFSAVNLLTGLAVAFGVLLAFPSGRYGQPLATIRPLGALRLTLYLLRQLVLSSILVARVIVSPRNLVRTGVIAHHLEEASDELLALMANVIALTPGTMTVEESRDPAVLYVHFLLLEDVDEARRAMAELERMCRGALIGASVPTTLREGSQ